MSGETGWVQCSEGGAAEAVARTEVVDTLGIGPRGPQQFLSQPLALPFLSSAHSCSL